MKNFKITPNGIMIVLLTIFGSLTITESINIFRYGDVASCALFAIWLFLSACCGFFLIGSSSEW